jgi:nitrite reductase (NADH) small subunit
MLEWVKVCRTEQVPDDGGACVTYEGVQIAVFRVAARNAWFAVQNRCPHWNEMVLSRAMTGEDEGSLKIACPMHKRTYSLEGGRCLSGDAEDIAAFAVKIEGDEVWIEKPSEQFLTTERRFVGEWGTSAGAGSNAKPSTRLPNELRNESPDESR